MAKLDTEPLAPHLDSESEEEDDETAPKSIVTGKALLAFSAFVLVAFVFMKSCLSIMLQIDAGAKGYPFVIQTVNLCAFTMQINFYTWQTTHELGFSGGFRALFGSFREMGPSVFYSTLVALSSLLQTLSQSYIDASLYIILMQLTLVLVALGDRFIIGKVSTLLLWLVVLMQAAIVIWYTMLSNRRTEKKEADAPATSTEHAGAQVSESVDPARQIIGISLCLLAETCSAVGSILQQRFMQVAAPDLLTSVKLWYQHFFGILVMIVTSLVQPSNIYKVWEHGFFVGWSWLTVATAANMWLYFLVASTVTSYVSALAGAMAAAVVVIVIAIYNAVILGKTLAPLQIVLMIALFCNTGLYTHLKDKQNQHLIQDGQMKEDVRITSAMSSAANKAHVKMARTYTSDADMERIAQRRWNMTNPKIVSLAKHRLFRTNTLQPDDLSANSARLLSGHQESMRILSSAPLMGQQPATEF